MLERLVSTAAPASTLLIRLIVGPVFLSEGIQKFLYPDENGIGRFAKIGIPTSLADLGLKDDQQDYVAEYSLKSARLIKNNPRQLDLSAMQVITRAAYAGDRASLEVA